MVPQPQIADDVAVDDVDVAHSSEFFICGRCGAARRTSSPERPRRHTRSAYRPLKLAVQVRYITQDSL